MCCCVGNFRMRPNGSLHVARFALTEMWTQIGRLNPEFHDPSRVSNQGKYVRSCPKTHEYSFIWKQTNRIPDVVYAFVCRFSWNLRCNLSFSKQFWSYTGSHLPLRFVHQIFYCSAELSNMKIWSVWNVTSIASYSRYVKPFSWAVLAYWYQ